MSTTDILQRGGADLQSTDDRARAAVKVFNRMQSSLTAYARALTGKSDVQVVMSADSNGHTDGKKIFFRPPLALGDNLPHDRKLCDTRDPVTRKQNCEACAVREAVLITIYHEIAHIAQDSFAVASEEDRAKMIKYALELVDKKFIEAVLARVESAPIERKGTAIGMAGLVSPYLPGIVNALEDARVNRDAAVARPGTRIMFEVDTTTVLGEGFEQKMPDGSVTTIFWRDRPLNVQIVCGLYVKAAGYNYREAFVPEVVAALDDVQINKLLRDFPTVRNAKGVYMIAVPVLARLRELGFMQHWTDPQVEEENDEPEPEPEESQDESGNEEDSDSGEQSESPEQGTGSDDGPESEDVSDSDSGKGNAGSGEAGETSEQEKAGDPGPSEEEPGSEDSTGSGDSASYDLDPESKGDAGLPPERSDSTDDSDQQSDQGQGEDEAESNDDEGASSDSQAGGLDEQSADSSDDSVPSDGSGESSDELGTDAEEHGDELESGSEDASGAGSDHDSSEAGSDAQSLGSGEVLDSDALGESEAVSGDDLDSNPDDGDSSDSTRKEDDEVSGETVDERGSATPDDISPDDGETVQPESDGEEPEVIDSGADEGLGGVQLIEDSAFDRLPMGTPEEVAEAIHEVAHPEQRPDHVKEEEAADKEMGRAVVQGLYFETPSRNVYGVREHYWNQPLYVDGYNTSQAWDQTGYSAWGYSRKQLGLDGEFDCPESILGPALLRMRVAFADNKRGRDVHNRKSGRVDGRVLGRRAFNDDPRLFKYRILPGKKDYFVLIGIDVSGSTIGRNIVLAKRAAMAQAELCSRMGIKFAVYAHSGNYHNPGGGRIDGIDVDVYHVKEPDEPWTDETRLRLTALGPDCQNLDGHTFEYYRKILDKRPETHKVMLYYTDGKMPAENHDEELIILQREIKTCRKRKYVLMGVGIRTDSPIQHGLDTVQVDDDQDIVKVVQHLEKRLLEI